MSSTGFISFVNYISNLVSAEDKIEYLKQKDKDGNTNLKLLIISARKISESKNLLINNLS